MLNVPECLSEMKSENLTLVMAKHRSQLPLMRVVSVESSG